MTYRLHIDVPIQAETREEAIEIARDLLHTLQIETIDSPLLGSGHEVNYRLGNDNDRQRSNYFDMDENGHCSNKKTRIKY